MKKPDAGKEMDGGNSPAQVIIFVAVILVVILGTMVIYFTVFSNPQIFITDIQLPSFSVYNETANLTVSLHFAVKNPSMFTFSHYGSNIEVNCNENPVGTIMIPAGEIGYHGSEYMDAQFSVGSVPFAPAIGGSSVTYFPSDGDNRTATAGYLQTLGVGSIIKMIGRVRILIFAHEINVSATCKAVIDVRSGSFLGGSRC